MRLCHSTTFYVSEPDVPLYPFPETQIHSLFYRYRHIQGLLKIQGSLRGNDVPCRPRSRIPFAQTTDGLFTSVSARTRVVSPSFDTWVETKAQKPPSRSYPINGLDRTHEKDNGWWRTSWTWPTGARRGTTRPTQLTENGPVKVERRRRGGTCGVSVSSLYEKLQPTKIFKRRVEKKRKVSSCWTYGVCHNRSRLKLLLKEGNPEIRTISY